MVKVIKKKRKLRLEGVITLLLLVSIVAFLCSFTIVRSHNVLLAKQLNEEERALDKLTNDVDNLEVEVKQLDNRERILEIAKQQGLNVNQNSIVSVVVETE